MKKRFAILLAVLFLFAGIGLSLHQHDDGHVHDDCLVCVVAAHHQSVKTGSASWAPIISFVFVFSIFSSVYVPVFFQTHKKARAPPF